MVTTEYGVFTVKTTAQGKVSIYVNDQCVLECTITECESLAALLDAAIIAYNITHQET